MCGIIGHVGDGDALETLLTGLENLEYRGYDSAGIAVQNGSGIAVQKRSGKVAELKDAVTETSLEGDVGIGHTRWSTHGPPTDENAHPHTDCTTDVAVVHNGIIENYAELKSWLRERGHEFTSDTDTEVIPHLIQYHLDQGTDDETAFRRAIDELEGSYAVAVMFSGAHVLYAARKGSPLVVGIEDDEFFLASDVPAFLEYTDSVVYLEDGDVVVVDEDGVEFTDLDGASITREPETVDWNPEQAGKGGYDHFMLKEIHEQPTSLSQAIEGRIDPADGHLSLDGFEPDTFESVEDVQLVACGTSYHAALYGSLALNRAGVPATALLANEYSVTSPPVSEDTLVIAVSQSGETADTLNALRQADERGADTLTVTNVVGSTAARVADDSLFIRAGPEIGVAATKTFSSQAVMVTLLAQRIADDARGDPPADLESLLPDLSRMPDEIDTLLETSDADAIAREYIDSQAYFFIGRGLGFPVALEGALKFKEITYEHAEGFASGELKHGPLALVTPETPVFAIFTGEEDEKTLKNAEETQTRGAPVIAICPDDHRAVEVADDHLEIPETDSNLAGLHANVQLQLVSYYAADLLGRPIDKPRNLAKSVTVE
ncbi:glutamine--fructose-6-phosphate transaminase (isomerizing) [Natronobacterium gregoryi]|uniref:Glutamine--fructose-6-phosphate aminotransferase [isomerizing] n=2 Tax=Natronobacterium gregoryi TaxID=44930 RepID=L0AN04_NATGS|nr:glutamine--fructose-6-phosphate transaminase (isomerizing) [Natronobacterium gregoryi]AFZ74460.1 glucosamine--fructose-6-phosphate aminotransferase, isomerizing [Natronobacterium gregoryi SP2]ELY72242.1 glucosamine--fructose-6-phosphate aminotransferase [Natronobacterium gregoryi SP2]PLK21791.1 glutamine--fructose-6-phosphate transaminase (isomerizing) [Natronobacterium gregoryi SP2]SFJ46191.1 glucosamine--fructose-6-phosphate aminotransferase (isomerizing) [Natronobacterium gregoryi]